MWDLSTMDEEYDPNEALGPQDVEALAKRLRTATANISNGFYTLTFPDGSHRTFRIHTQNPAAKFAPGKRVISLLIGPENTRDYEMVGFLEAAGPLAWKRHQNTKVGVYMDMLWDLANGEEMGGCRLEISKRCLLCNRMLSDPESLAAGAGPECRKYLEIEDT